MRGVTGAPRHILMTADAVGGVWGYALDLARGLAARGVRTTLAVLGPAPDAAQRAAAAAVPGLALEVTGLPLDWLAGTPAEVEAAGQAVAARAAALGVDLVHLNSPALAVAHFGVPVLGACHSCLATWWEAVRGGPLPADFAWRTALLSRGYAAADALVAPTHAFAEATRRAHALARPPEVVPNGRAGGVPAHADGAFAFTAGRLWDEGKDLVTLDRAAARLDAPVLAAGPVRGPNGAAVPLAHLRLLGTLDDAALRAELARGPVFVSAARYEPFGLAVLEAAQAGCALVLSDIPTFRELWDRAAVFVPPGDDVGFAQAIGGLLRDRERRAELRVAARERACRHGPDAMADGVHRIHRRLLARVGPRSGREAA
ncbi:glycosyltransferase family 4 protein [Falsiroseomonas sp. CW058]|uniref:glycosyltransferase family 4 protein n=1 Tax=Falsiroseomonas sp. CW058 TaxID=3388664 RepID=UPI003D310FBE